MSADQNSDSDAPLSLASIWHDAEDGWDWQVNVRRSDAPEMARHLRDMADAIEREPQITIN